MMQNIEAIILAAGTGSRFGGGKLVARYKGGALIDGAVRAALAAPVSRTILVTGHDADRVAAVARQTAAGQSLHTRLDVVHAHDYAKGMAESLCTGVAALSSGAEAAFVFLGDMPEAPASIAARLAGAIGEHAAAAPSYRGRRGHPVLFAARLFPALMQLTGDRGASRLLSDLREDLVLVEAEDPGVLFDVDHPSALKG
jgi:molybdenum cofactor cytidylyltransferase